MHCSGNESSDKLVSDILWGDGVPSYMTRIYTMDNIIWSISLSETIVVRAIFRVKIYRYHMNFRMKYFTKNVNTINYIFLRTVYM